MKELERSTYVQMVSMFSLKSIHNFVNLELQASIQNRISFPFYTFLVTLQRTILQKSWKDACIWEINSMLQTYRS